MFNKILMSAAVSVALCAPALTQERLGSAAEARAMLEKAIAAVKTDKAKAIASFNSGTDGFKDRDLYPFCFNIADGKFVAGQSAFLGVDVRTLKDKAGNAFGSEIFKAALEGRISETATYMFPKPEQTVLSQKVSFVSRAGDVGCGVGYYK